MAEDLEVQAVEALIAGGDDREAFSRLDAAFGWPRGRALAADVLVRWLAPLGELATRRGAPRLAELVAAALHDPDSPDRLYALGYALIDAGAPRVAATILWRCLGLVGDSEEVVCELVSALESALAYPDALAILEDHAALRERSFLAQYLYAFNAAMSGRLDVTRAAFGVLAPDSPETETMRGTIAAILERADRVGEGAPLDARDLRGWQFVLTGTLVGHLSPYGFDKPMHGRYAWLQDSVELIATGLARLEPLVRAAGVPCVYAPPGRGHEILAHAAAARLGLPLAAWPAIGVPAPGLIVVHDLADLPVSEVPRLVERRAEQILFAHASPWTHDAPIAPDVTTLLYQSLVPPWGGSTIVDPASGKVSRAAADDRDPEEIAAEIVASDGLDADEIAVDSPARWDALLARVWPPSPGPRSRLWAGGPVPSSAFA